MRRLHAGGDLPPCLVFAFWGESCFLVATMAIPATLKWGAKTLTLEVDPEEPLEVFQAQIL